MTAICTLLCLTTVTMSCPFAYRINAAHSADCPPTHTHIHTSGVAEGSEEQQLSDKIRTLQKAV
jgi:hypothetical protein